MSQNPPTSGEPPFVPPVSVFAGPIAELVSHRLLSPPNRPGLLASLEGYEILRVLGGGGMGVVVLGRNSESSKEVAIKLIRPELVSDQRVVHRFVKEAGHLQKLKHPSVIPVLEVSDRPSGPYFVMPYFERGSLASRIRPGQPLPSEEILDLGRQVAEGLGFAHRHGIIHRDLKPANILLAADGKCCLADFGLARTMFNDSIIDVEKEQLEGTAPYMSPGVAAGNAEDTRCDIYSFGALLYEMLTGEPPYVGRSTQDIRRQILGGPPKSIKERNPEADESLTVVAEGAMARELRHRYASMDDVIADLDRIHAGKTPHGPHGIANQPKTRANMWIPAGILMIAVGLWLMWSNAEKKQTPGSPGVQTNSHPVVLPKTTAPPVIAPQTSPPLADHWTVVPLAGKWGEPGSADGAGNTAQFRSPLGIAADISGNCYVADSGNNIIRKITVDGKVTTIAGVAGQAGSLNGKGSSARFTAPNAVAVSPDGKTVFVAEFVTGTIRRIADDGTVTTLAGAAGYPGSKDGSGENAQFRNPWGLTMSSLDILYVADKDNDVVRSISSNGKVTTLAGIPGIPGSSNGQDLRAQFNAPHCIAASGPNLFVGDTGNNTIRQITLAGVTTLAGSTGQSGMVDGTGSDARFQNIQCMACRSQNPQDFFVLDGARIRYVLTYNKSVTTIPLETFSIQGKTIQPTSIACGGFQTLYLMDEEHNVLWKATIPANFGR